MGGSDFTYEELKTELGKCVESARKLVNDFFILATKCAVVSNVPDDFKKTVNVSLHSYRYAIDNFNLLYRIVHAEELGFSKTDLLTDVIEMDNVAGPDSDLMLNRGDVSGLRAIREDDIVLYCCKTVRLLRPGIIDELPEPLLTEMESVLTCINADGDLELSHGSTIYSKMFIKDVMECFDMFKSYQMIHPFTKKIVNDVRKQLISYVAREQERRKKKSKKRAYLPHDVIGVISGSFKEVLYNAYAFKMKGVPPSKRQKKTEKSVSAVTTNQDTTCIANPIPVSNGSSSDNHPSVVTPSITNTPESDIPSTDVPSSTTVTPVVVHSISTPSHIKDLSVLAGEVGESDSQDDDYELPKRRYTSKTQKEIMNKKMEFARMKKREKT